jgi:hypothetical protein
MQIPSGFATTFGTPASAAFGLLGRIAQAVQPMLSPGAASSGAVAGAMTPERVRAALLEMGAAAADADVVLAEALVQAGLPLTAASLAEAHGELARAAGASAQSYVVAKVLELPTSPDTLRALTTVLAAGNGKLPVNALPEQVRVWLGLGIEASTLPEAQTRHLREMLQQIGRSTEHRLLAAAKDPEHGFPISDMRTALMRLSESSGDRSLRAEADSMARLVEGQQLLNQAGLRAHEGRAGMPLYFAVPLGFDGTQTIAETCLWLPKREESEENAEESESVLRVTVRVAPPRLGRVQIDLTGQLTGSLSCRLGAEKQAAVRLLGRHTDLLAVALSEAGWTTCDVICRHQADWGPLWPGAEAFTTPRTSVDWFV